ncbi:helix-turn-helix domain-containing protein [Mucilaginibacter sp. L196]|uniref:helix-turn-helix domain-containing protein n=1 Tax=Mucilaginibacter sp. L196 TaxID=1641870 RepID=UPI00131B97DB|nr:helix-turn-helix domain-containing protein [Mucilaginibacter sp. L196]
MRKKNKSIPVNTMADDFDAGISIERMSLSTADEARLNSSDEAKLAHRHDSHSFFLLEKGTVNIEIDFQKYIITAPSIIYVHPDQVHRTTAFDNMTVCSWAITNENLNPEYLKLLESITPAKPLVLNEETFSLISEAVLLFMKFAERKSDKLFHSLLKDSCNALVALVASQYLESAKPIDRLSRFEIVTKTFREILERNYTTTKRPADYAEKLNITTPYLNECVKNATGHPVSYHIQQRVILEAKRLLYYSDKSVKEIAIQLGYDDYPYFSRLFTKVTGMTALSFRNKNFD